MQGGPLCEVQLGAGLDMLLLIALGWLFVFSIVSALLF